MPLAEHCRGVTGSLQRLRKGRQLIAKLGTVPRLTVRVRMKPCEQRGPTRSADRISHEALVELHASASQRVDIRRGIDLRPVSTDCVLRMVVGIDDDEVRFVGRGGAPWREAENRQQRERSRLSEES